MNIFGIIFLSVIAAIAVTVGLYYYVGACINHQKDVDIGMDEQKPYYMRMSDETIARYKKIRWTVIYYTAKFRATYSL